MKINDWISTKDRLPETNNKIDNWTYCSDEVLICLNKNEVVTGRFYKIDYLTYSYWLSTSGIYSYWICGEIGEVPIVIYFNKEDAIEVLQDTIKKCNDSINMIENM